MDAVTTPAQGPSRWVAQAREFFVAVRSELQKVTWPSREELLRATRMIVVLTVILGLLIGWMDWLLNAILVTGIARLTR
jgi:preprotein translocase subunit SecE